MPFTKGRYHSSSPVRKIPKISKGNSQKLMIVSPIARPVLSENFNGLIGVWRVEKNYEAKRKSKNHLRDTYKIDTTIDASYFYNIMTSTIMPEIASKMNFADSVTVQLDNARPHVGKDNINFSMILVIL